MQCGAAPSACPSTGPDHSSPVCSEREERAVRVRRRCQGHCPQPGATSADGAGGPGHTKQAASRSSAARIFQRWLPLLLLLPLPLPVPLSLSLSVSASASVIRARYRVACSIRGRRLLPRLRQKRRLVSRQIEGERCSTVRRAAFGLRPFALRANNEVFRCHRTLFKASSSTERTQASQSVTMFSSFVRSFVSVKCRGHGGRNEK